MCGITGIIRLSDAAPVEEGILRQMNSRLSHRGPDDDGFHFEPGVGLGHRRLSIIDLTTGHQPIYNEDRSVVIVFNGEIYNYKALVSELMSRGHKFKTQSDTEAIVHGWEEWGPSCVEKLRGMFAFVIWDRNTRTLFAARDHLGVKPLYYAELPGDVFIFASELKGLLAYPGVSSVLDPLAVEEYFAFGYIPEPRSILKGVRKLPPGHYIHAQSGGGSVSTTQYWDVPFELHRGRSEDELRDELVSQLRESVELQLISEVPLGAFLSGGVDSSSVVAMMSQVSREPVKTCSIAFDDERFNEAHFAALVAERYSTDHFSESVHSDDFSLLDKLAGLYDEPYADSSALPTYRLCEITRKKVTVALSGDGGDENFAGYRSYGVHLRTNSLRSVIPGSVRGPFFGSLARLYPKLDWAPKFLRAKRTFSLLSKSLVDAFAQGAMITTDEERRELFSSSFTSSLQGYGAREVIRRHAKQSPTENPLSLMQYLDLKVYLPADILTKVDRASMAHSLEVRVPLLDHQFVEWASGIPPELQYKGGTGKYLFKQALAPYLPSPILNRSKMGFSIPLSRWFRGPLRERVRERVLSPQLLDGGIFASGSLKRVIDEHERGVRDHGSLLWSLVMFEASIRGLSGEKR